MATVNRVGGRKQRAQCPLCRKVIQSVLPLFLKVEAGQIDQGDWCDKDNYYNYNYECRSSQS